ncbi:hypothetical protein IM774_06285 [Erysipelotrichaceae bacterium RD49]|nr:hypothetical protein [Erysipelotrichaceae bacterium RD49]
MEHRLKLPTRLSAILLGAILFVSVPLSPINAKSIEASPTINQVNWWPGDPNPRPGSEAWLQQNTNVRAGNMEAARRCGLQALAPAGIGAGADTFYIWLMQRVWTVGSFARTFGISWVVGYFDCIIRDSFA